MDRLKIIKETAQHFKEYDFYTTIEYEDFLWLTETIEKQQQVIIEWEDAFVNKEE